MMQPTPKDVKWMDAAAISWADMRVLAVDAHAGYGGGNCPKYSSGYEAGHELSPASLQNAADSRLRAFGDYLITLGERLRESVPLTEGDLDVIAVHVGATFGGRFTEVRPHVKHGQTDLAGWNPDALAIIHIESVHPGAMGPGGSVYGLPASIVLRDLVARLNKHMNFSSPVGIERTNPAVLSVVAL